MRPKDTMTQVGFILGGRNNATFDDFENAVTASGNDSSLSENTQFGVLKYKNKKISVKFCTLTLLLPVNNSVTDGFACN